MRVKISIGHETEELNQCFSGCMYHSGLHYGRHVVEDVVGIRGLG